MKLLLIAAFLFSTNALARKGNFIEAHALRLSGEEYFEEWLLPHYHSIPGNDSFIKVSAMGSVQTEIFDLIEQIDTEQEEKIVQQLDKTLGLPYDAHAKVGLSVQAWNFQQSLGASAGAVYIVNNPVFPELNGILFNDFTTTSAYSLTLPYQVRLRPNATLGIRRIMENDFDVTALVDQRPNLKLNDRPYQGFSEFGFHASRTFFFGEPFLILDAFPIHGEKISYWKTELGAKSPDLVSLAGWPFPAKAYFTFSFSPLYGGNYSLERTLKPVLSVYWLDFFWTDFFLYDGLGFGFMAKFQTPFVDLSFFTFERSYDNFGFFDSRQYGGNLRIYF